MQHPQMMQLANITTEQIQKCLDDNKQLIMAIMEYQNMGKIADSASYQAQLQHNLMYLAKIADIQPPASSAPLDKLFQMSAPPVKQHQQFVSPSPGFKRSFLSNNQQQQQQQQSPVPLQQQQVLHEQTGIKGGNRYHGMDGGFGNNFMSMQQQETTFDISDAAVSLQENSNQES